MPSTSIQKPSLDDLNVLGASVCPEMNPFLDTPKPAATLKKQSFQSRQEQSIDDEDTIYSNAESIGLPIDKTRKLIDLIQGAEEKKCIERFESVYQDTIHAFLKSEEKPSLKMPKFAKDKIDFPSIRSSDLELIAMENAVNMVETLGEMRSVVKAYAENFIANHKKHQEEYRIELEKVRIEQEALIEHNKAKRVEASIVNLLTSVASTGITLATNAVSFAGLTASLVTGGVASTILTIPVGGAGGFLAVGTYAVGVGGIALSSYASVIGLGVDVASTVAQCAMEENAQKQQLLDVLSKVKIGCTVVTLAGTLALAAAELASIVTMPVSGTITGAAGLMLKTIKIAGAITNIGQGVTTMAKGGYQIFSGIDALHLAEREFAITQKSLEAQAKFLEMKADVKGFEDNLNAMQQITHRSQEIMRWASNVIQQKGSKHASITQNLKS